VRPDLSSKSRLTFEKCTKVTFAQNKLQ